MILGVQRCRGGVTTPRYVFTGSALLTQDIVTGKGVVAMNTPGQNSNAVAELAFGMMLMAARNNFDGSLTESLST